MGSPLAVQRTTTTTTTTTLPPTTTTLPPPTTTTPPPPTSTTLPPPTSTTLPPSTTITTSTTGTPPLTTTTTGKGTTPTTLPSPIPTTIPPPLPGNPPTATTTGQLNVSRPSGTPGSPLTAAGEGCDPGAAVLLSLGGLEVGQTTADPSGAFSVPLTVPNIAVGQYPVVAQCGPTLTTVLGVTLLTNADPDSLAFVILIFFVLAGLLLLQLMLRREKGNE